MINFIPAGFKEDQIKPVVISRFAIQDRKLVVCEYGAMIGVFDFKTGGKVTDFCIYDHPGLTNQQYIEAAIKKAQATIDFNLNWLQVLEQLPEIN